MLSFFNMYTGPKMMLLNQGGHAEPDGIGLEVNRSYIFHHAFLFLENYLKQVTNHIQELSPLQFQLGGSMLSDTYVGFSSDLRTGVAFDKAESLGIPFYTNLTAANQTTSIIYSYDGIQQPMTLCGTPTVQLRLLSPTSTSFQIYGFLYLIDPTNPDQGELISESVFTRWGDDTADVTPNTFSFPFHTLCRVVNTGFSIAVGFVLHNELFLPSNTAASLNVEFIYGADTFIRLPLESMSL